MHGIKGLCFCTCSYVMALLELFERKLVVLWAKLPKPSSFLKSLVFLTTLRHMVYLPFVLFRSGSGAGHSLKEAGIFWSVLMIVSFLFQAADTVLKVRTSRWLFQFNISSRNIVLCLRMWQVTFWLFLGSDFPWCCSEIKGTNWFIFHLCMLFRNCSNLKKKKTVSHV